MCIIHSLEEITFKSQLEDINTVAEFQDLFIFARIVKFFLQIQTPEMRTVFFKANFNFSSLKLPNFFFMFQ